MAGECNDGVTRRCWVHRVCCCWTYVRRAKIDCSLAYVLHLACLQYTMSQSAAAQQPTPRAQQLCFHDHARLPICGSVLLAQ